MEKNFNSELINCGTGSRTNSFTVTITAGWFYLRLFRMFCSPIRIENNCAKDNEKDKYQDNTKALHYSSPPLLRYNPKQNDKIKNKTNIVRGAIDNLKNSSLVKAPAKIILEKSKNTSDSFSFCFLLNCIISTSRNIIPKIKDFVKRNFLICYCKA